MKELIDIHRKIIDNYRIDRCFVCYGQTINNICYSCGFEA